jgi:ComF family protein
MTAIFDKLALFPRRVARAALDLLLPPLCMMCRKQVGEPGSLCAECWQNVSFLDGPACSSCGLPFEFEVGEDTRCATCLTTAPAFDRARSVMRYDEFSKGPILALKRADRHDVVPAFARWLERAGRDLISDADVIVPVPLHPLRLWMRRFNQSALLARALARRTHKPYEPLALLRTRSTPSQGEMPSAKARRKNVRGAFRVDANRAPVVKGRNVLLVDDVLTTGATVDACARALKRAGAAKVAVLTLARVARPL